MPATINTMGQPYRGPVPLIKYYPVKAGETFKVGDWLALDSGEVAIAAAANNNVGNVKVLGRANANAADVLAGTAGGDAHGRNLCGVEVPQDDTEYLWTIYHATEASAVLELDDLPTSLPIRNQGGQWVLGLAGDGTNDRVALTERHPGDADEELYPRFWGKLIETGKEFES